jgi:DNA-binding SARP family transcriptional activator/tetratricopeptide (TPR) repeat protein
MVEFEVLGPVRVRRDGGTVEPRGRLQRMLLGLLLARANQPVSVDALTDALWDGAPDDRAEQKLQLHVHRLRRALGVADRLTLGPAGYQVAVLPDELDADRFETWIDEAAQVAGDDPGRGVELLRKALGLWRGTPYEGLDLPELAAEAQRLSDRRLAAIEELHRAQLIGDPSAGAGAVAELTDLVRRHPLRERLHGLLMVALYRSGRQADALQAYQDARRTLVDELGLEPGPELQRIEKQILAGEAVTLDGPPADRPAPAQLPARPRGFVGRGAELTGIDALASRSDESVTLAVLSGTAGVGKTALAVSSAYRIRDRFPDGQLYVDLRGYGPDLPLAPVDVLGGFLRALGVEGAAVPPDLDERAARFRSLLDRRRMLVVLDNARTVDQVRPLLPGTPSCFVIVTSRDALTGLGAREGAHRISLDRLPADEATDLLRDLAGPDLTADPGATARLVDQCARLPLALRIAADLVRVRPARGVAGLVDELADERDRLDLLDVDDTHLAVRAVFSWSYQQLSAPTAYLFRMCGLHPGHDFDAYALAALGDVELRDARRSLDTLVRAHLVDETAGGRFQPHDLLRAYARELADSTETDAERQAALARLAAYYVQAAAAATEQVTSRERRRDRRPVEADPSIAVPTFADYDAGLAWLDAELVNLLTAVGDPERTIQLSSMLWHYLIFGGYYVEGLELHTRALEAARSHGDRSAEADSHRFLAGVLADIGRHDTAQAHAESALDGYRELGDLNGEARTHVPLAAICHGRGRLREAVRHLERIRELERELGRPNTGSLTNLANAHGTLGNHEQALGYASQALDLAEVEDDRVSVAHALGNLAVVSERMGRLDDAAEYSHRLLSAANRDGVRMLESAALYVLGSVHRRRGEYATSLHHHRRGLELARSGGAANEVAEAMNGLGRTLRADGDPAGAIQQHREALGLTTDHGYRLEEAHARVGLGDAYADLDDPDAAREQWGQALEILRELGLPGADEVAAKLELA